jgi:hypothetical protein
VQATDVVGKKARNAGEVVCLSFRCTRPLSCICTLADDDDDGDDGDVVLTMKDRFPALWQAAAVRCTTSSGVFFACMRARERACMKWHA